MPGRDAPFSGGRGHFSEAGRLLIVPQTGMAGPELPMWPPEAGLFFVRSESPGPGGVGTGRLAGCEPGSGVLAGGTDINSIVHYVKQTSALIHYLFYRPETGANRG